MFGFINYINPSCRNFGSENCDKHIGMKYIYIINSFLIVGTTAFLVALSRLEMVDAFPLDIYSLSFNRTIGYLNFSFTFLSILGAWIFLTALAYLTSIVFDSNGSFIKLLMHSGYGFFPLMITSFILYLMIEGIINDYLIFSNEELNLQEMNAMLHEDNRIIFLKYANRVAQMMLLLWIIYGIRLHYQLSVMKSVLSVFTPVFLIVLFSKLM